MSPPSLYQRLGGADGVQRLVTEIVERHYRNPLIRQRFEVVKDRAALERHVIEFLSAGSGGPPAYGGRDLPTAHRGMNINEQELIAAMDDIVAALKAQGHDAAVQGEIVAILYSLKDEVLRR